MEVEDNNDADRYRAPELDKGLDILEWLAEQKDGLTRAEITKLLGRNAKERLTEVKRGLMSILEMLNARPGDVRAYAPPSTARAAQPVKRKNGSRPAKPPAKATKKRR